MPRIWEQITDESKAQYELFVLYRSLSPEERSIERLYDTAPPDLRLPIEKLRRLSARYDWDSRAEAFDEQARRMAQKAREEAVRLMNERHIDLGKILQDKAKSALQILDPAVIPVPEIRQFAAEGARLERTARGEPETVVETRQGSTEAQRQATIETIRQAIEEFMFDTERDKGESSSAGPADSTGGSPTA